MAMTFAYESIGEWLIVTCDWTSDAMGDASDATARIVGELVKGTTIPGQGGVQPLDDYDITLTDRVGIDVLGPSLAKLTNRDNVNDEAAYFCFDGGTDLISRVPAIADALTITVAAAGALKEGRLILLVRGRLAGTNA